MKRLALLVGSLALFSLLLAACAAPTPQVIIQTAAPVVQTQIVEKQVTQVVEKEVTQVVQVTAAAPALPTAVVKLPDGAISQPGKLRICTDFPYPPQEFYDEKGVPQGLDVEIGTEIAARLGVQVEFTNSVFDTIIAAVKADKCDIIVSAQNITTDRKKQVSMIPYFQAGQSMVAAKGNPQNITTPDDLCGKSAAAESGTTEADYLQGTGDYQDKGLTQKCAAAGKQPIDVVVTQKDTDALQQLQSGKVAVYFADSPVAAYYTVEHPDQFQLVGQIMEPIPEGISVPCDQEDCTNAPLTPRGQAVQDALKSMMADGAYAKILAKWNLAGGAVTLP